MSNLTNCKMSKLFLGRSLSSGVLQTKLCENIIFSKQGIDTFREAVSSKSLPKFRKVNKLEKGITNYSVLVPFVSPNGKEEELHLLYTKRAAFLRSHSREICFPGGKVEENETLEIAALRETREELSIPEESVQIIASLQPVPTRKGKGIVTPLVGIVKDITTIKPCTEEVERTILVPLSELIDESTLGYTQFKFNENSGGYSLPVYRTNSQDRIWGMTAIMTYQVLTTLLNRNLYRHRIPYQPPY